MLLESKSRSSLAQTAVASRRLILCIALVASTGCSDNKREGQADNAVGIVGTPSLPPSIATSHTYRCSDNSLLFVDFLSDGTSLDLRTSRDDAPARMTAATPGLPFVGAEMTATVEEKLIILRRDNLVTRTCRRE